MLRAPFAPVIQVAEGAFVFLGPSPILPQSGGLSQDSRPSKCQGYRDRFGGTIADAVTPGHNGPYARLISFCPSYSIGY